MNQRSVPPDNLRPLEASLFSFHEYGNQLDGARRALRGARLRDGTPDVEIIDAAVFVPSVSAVGRQRSRQDGKQPLLAGIVGSDGEPVAAASMQRGGRRLIAGLGSSAPAVPVPEVEVDEEVVYLGWLFDYHFGHFLLESLARTWILTELDPSLRVVFHHRDPAHFTPAGWLPRILAAFGVPRERILVPETPTRFRRVIVPEPLLEIGHSAHEGAATPYQAVASRIVGGVTPSTQPVYLSRRLLPAPRRQTIGEAELEDVLRENGFLVAYPETMRFEDQVRLFNAHTDIFASVGSAVHNVLFALHRPRLHLLTSGSFPSKSYFICSALVGAPTAFVNCLDTGERSSGGDEQRARRMPEVVATAPLAEYLDERGLLKTRARAALAGRDPALRRAYDEAWFFTWFGAARKGEAIPTAVEREAVDFAPCSWPVSLALAAWYAKQRDAARLDAMVRQFATLAAAEFDLNRLAYYRAEVERIATTIRKHCQPDTAKRLAQVVSDQFRIDISEAGDGRGKRPVAPST